MVAIDVTSPARPRSSASARVTAASTSSGDRKASGQRREVVIIRLSKDILIRRSFLQSLFPRKRGQQAPHGNQHHHRKFTIRSTERRAFSAIAGSITTSSLR